MVDEIFSEMHKILKMAKLRLTDEELSYYSNNLKNVLGWLDQISLIDTSNVDPMVYGNPSLSSKWRNDEVKIDNNRDELLSNTKPQHGCFVVPKTVDGNN